MHFMSFLTVCFIARYGYQTRRDHGEDKDCIYADMLRAPAWRDIMRFPCRVTADFFGVTVAGVLQQVKVALFPCDESTRLAQAILKQCKSTAAVSLKVDERRYLLQ